MNLARPNTAAPFVNVQPLGAKDTPAPEMTMVDWRNEPADTKGLVTVRYHGHETDRHGTDATRFSVRNDPFSSGEPWYEVRGPIEDAVRAARDLAVAEGYEEDPAAGTFARSSVAVLGVGDGVWHLSALRYPEGMGDGMDALISMPIDLVPASQSDVSVPYGQYGKRGFDTPDKVMVRFDDPRVAALVGVDSVAYAPKG